jgi:hypothetical protein
MRLLGVIGFILGAPIFAQELDIDGYSKVVIPRVQGSLINTYSAVREAARDAGFEVHASLDEIAIEARPLTLYITAGLADFSRLTVYIAVIDVATQLPVAYCARAASAGRPRRGSVVGPGVEAALKHLIEDLGYQGFKLSAHEANVRALNLVANVAGQSALPAASASPETPRMSCAAEQVTSETIDRATRRSRARDSEQ